MNCSWVSSSSVLSAIYWGISLSSCCSAVTYSRLAPLVTPTPPSSLYCCHKSVSRISAAAKNRKMAASPLCRLPLASSAKADSLSGRSAETKDAAPATATPFLKNERRPDGFCEQLGETGRVIGNSLIFFVRDSKQCSTLAENYIRLVCAFDSVNLI